MLPAAAAFTLVRNRARARRKRPRKGLWHGSWPSRAQASSGTGQPQPGLAMPLLRDQEGWQGARHSGLPPAQPAGLHRRGRALPPSRPARWYHGAAGSTGKLRSLRASAVPGCWRQVEEVGLEGPTAASAGQREAWARRAAGWGSEAHGSARVARTIAGLKAPRSALLQGLSFLQNFNLNQVVQSFKNYAFKLAISIRIRKQTGLPMHFYKGTPQTAPRVSFFFSARVGKLKLAQC